MTQETLMNIPTTTLEYSVFDIATGVVKHSMNVSYPVDIPVATPDELVILKTYPKLMCLDSTNTPQEMPGYPQQGVNNTYTFDRSTWTWLNTTNIAALKETIKTKINLERERRNELPIQYQNITWDADPQSQRNVSAWMATLAAGSTLPQGFVWRAADNVNHAADADFVNGLGTAMTLRGTQLYQASWAKKSELDALATVELVNAYDVTKGW
jgi:Domain of unknown function (DUF4376)